MFKLIQTSKVEYIQMFQKSPLISKFRHGQIKLALGRRSHNQRAKPIAKFPLGESKHMTRIMHMWDFQGSGSLQGVIASK